MKNKGYETTGFERSPNFQQRIWEMFGWAIHRQTAVIPKSINPERIKQNLNAADLSLSQEDMQEMAGFDRHRRYISGTFWAQEGSPYTIANLWDE